MVDRASRKLKPATAARAFLAAGLTLAWVFLLCFALLHAMPGDPVDRIDSSDVPAEQAERNRRALGLDEPLPRQLLSIVTSYARGDLGVSTTRRRPVAAVLGEALPYSAALGVVSLALAYGVGLPLALLLVSLAPRSRRALDRGILVAATLPRFWLAVMLVLLLHGMAGWFPASHAFSPGGGDWLDFLRHLALPALALGAPAACVVARYQLAAMERVLAEPHVLAARAKGSSRARLLLHHVLRSSAGSAVALFGLDLPVIVSGAIVVEVVFAWPGMGRLIADSVLGADYPLALALSVVTAATVILGRMVAEYLAVTLDPRSASAFAVGVE